MCSKYCVVSNATHRRSHGQSMGQAFVVRVNVHLVGRVVCVERSMVSKIVGIVQRAERERERERERGREEGERERERERVRGGERGREMERGRGGRSERERGWMGGRE